MSKVIFLDIDSVLQPYSSSKRFQYGIERAVRDAIEETGDSSYEYMDPYDVAAAKCDWHPKAMENLRCLIEDTGAVIIMESDWRIYNDLFEMRLLFKLWDLDQYVKDNLPKGDKQDVIDAYLECNPEVKEWVVLDDIDLGYGKRQVITYNYLTEEDTERAFEILSGEVYWFNLL